jgi:hypothetical protein
MFRRFFQFRKRHYGDPGRFRKRSVYIEQQGSVALNNQGVCGVHSHNPIIIEETGVV